MSVLWHHLLYGHMERWLIAAVKELRRDRSGTLIPIWHVDQNGGHGIELGCRLSFFGQETLQVQVDVQAAMLELALGVLDNLWEAVVRNLPCGHMPRNEMLVSAICHKAVLLDRLSVLLVGTMDYCPYLLSELSIDHDARLMLLLQGIWNAGDDPCVVALVGTAYGDVVHAALSPFFQTLLGETFIGNLTLGNAS